MNKHERYNRSEKGKARSRRYNETPAGRARSRRYDQSAAGERRAFYVQLRRRARLHATEREVLFERLRQD